MNKMREYRLAAGMTAKQLGSMLHLSESSITMYETGKREPSPTRTPRSAPCPTVWQTSPRAGTRLPTSRS